MTEGSPTAEREPATGATGTGPSDSRDRIMDAAERLFAHAGYDKTAVSKIASEAGVPKGLIFYYFPAKSDLLVALVTERVSLPALDEATSVVPGDVAATLRRLADAYEEWVEGSYTARRILYREAEAHPEVRSGLADTYQQLWNLIRRTIDEALGDRVARVSAERRDAVATAYAAVVSLAGNMHHLGTADVDVAAVADALARSLADNATDVPVPATADVPAVAPPPVLAPLDPPPAGLSDGVTVDAPGGAVAG